MSGVIDTSRLGTGNFPADAFPYLAPADSDRRKKTLHLTIDSSLSDVSLVGLAVRGICAHTPLPREAHDEMEICVVEAVTNAICHAYHCKPGFTVEATIILYDDRICFEISEYGTAMDAFRPPTLEYDPSETACLPEKGMGLFIISSIMDKVNYRSSNGRNTLSFCKYFSPESC
ncbi:ATP-binding protein [Geomonas sp. RF6]|uniref:ATP-binding protein n=1 Tax=Geomonas sp. RF6 TaxID=2897342 RepID=UPI001E48661A|nr:ATP-binding protein [Geomonas sp. RF6]UFS70559.1 ATP-binding protein [Geomonas sp. RF6]